MEYTLIFFNVKIIDLYYCVISLVYLIILILFYSTNNIYIYIILFKSKYHFNQHYFQFRCEKTFPPTSPEKFPLWKVKACIKSVHARFPTRQFRVPQKYRIYFPSTESSLSNDGDALFQQWWWCEPWHNNSCFIPCTHRVRRLDVYTGASELICFIFNPLNIYLTRAPLIFLHC